LRSGELIVSRLTVEGRAARLLIEDPIPAGCEQITEAGGLDLTYKVKDFSAWYSEREFRDNRTALFVNRLDGRRRLFLRDARASSRRFPRRTRARRRDVSTERQRQHRERATEDSRQMIVRPNDCGRISNCPVRDEKRPNICTWGENYG
jgi:hypothetical protein